MRKMMGYYRYPTIYKDKIVFVAEEDLWEVSINGGIARRLTANLGAVSRPHFSPDGKWITFTGTEEGHPEIYVMSSEGGSAKRITYNGIVSLALGWHNDKILFASTLGQPFRSLYQIYEIDLDGNEYKKLDLGIAKDVSFGEKGVVIGRNVGDPAMWKRYRGGTAGELWVDENGDGNFHKLLDLKGHFTSPMWIDERIYFVCDYEGIY